jgi:hypothetical protein
MLKEKERESVPDPLTSQCCFQPEGKTDREVDDGKTGKALVHLNLS